MIHWPSTIGTGTASGGDLLAEVLPWVLILLAFVVVASVVIMWLHRRVRSDHPSATGGGFTLHDLRQMHARGELTDEEFQRAREAVIAGVRHAASENEADHAPNESDASEADPGEDE
jgi:uncharacterized membrane protein